MAAARRAILVTMMWREVNVLCRCRNVENLDLCVLGGDERGRGDVRGKTPSSIYHLQSSQYKVDEVLYNSTCNGHTAGYKVETKAWQQF